METETRGAIADARHIVANPRVSSDGRKNDPVDFLIGCQHLEQRHRLYVVRADGLYAPRSETLKSEAPKSILLVGHIGAGKSTLAAALVAQAAQGSLSYFLGSGGAESEFGLMHIGSEARVFPLVETPENWRFYGAGATVADIVRVKREGSGPVLMEEKVDPQRLVGYLGADLYDRDESPENPQRLDAIQSLLVGPLLEGKLRYHSLRNVTGKLDEAVSLLTGCFFQ
ncbi:hypothetical protein COV20_00990 [Candidatus Woesearchaeota archaeon CG10_big_fil_rev_8_21_14_0_10_45_16]|nr:MAG: hypothetical protein COV20_00990 [Candidatus Woesearchaeota archaeon CG10_big_fil_rev_8_21_14_0_10_45_16]